MEPCSEFGELGVFGILLGLACHTTPLVGNMLLYGENPDKDQDGELTCADYDAAGDNGILLSLLCNPDLVPVEGIVEMRFKEERKRSP